MSLRSLRDRLTRIEDELDGGGGDGGDGNGLTVIRITGDQHAKAGDLYFQREHDESLPAFEARIWQAAADAGEPFVVIGGLPDWYGDE